MKSLAIGCLILTLVNLSSATYFQKLQKVHFDHEKNFGKGGVASQIANPEHHNNAKLGDHNPEDNTPDMVKIPDPHFKLSQGDMIVLKDDAPAERVGNTRIKWDNKILYYAFGDSASKQSDFKRSVRAALDDIEKCTCVRFEERTNQNNYVRIIRDQGCYSYVGEIGGAQDLSLGDGCEIKGIMQHEFLHALGMEHQHSRPDRDSYVKVRLDHVTKGTENNFEKVSANKWTTLGLPYDYNSLMHYGSFDFSAHGLKTVEAPDEKTFIGQREGLSEMDIKFLNKFYGCSEAESAQCTTEAITCEDTQTERQCGLWDKDGYCKASERTYMYQGFMHQSCRKTCGFCNEHLKKEEEGEDQGQDQDANQGQDQDGDGNDNGGQAECRDQEPNNKYCLHTFAGLYCRFYPEYMNSRCQKTCGKC